MMYTASHRIHNDISTSMDQTCSAPAGVTPTVVSTRAVAGTTAAERIERLVIEQTVAQIFGVSGGDLRRATRGRAHVARARQVGMYLAHVACGLTLTDVGRVFERDRTTVAHACGVIEDGRDDPTFDHVLELLERAVMAMLKPRCERPCRREGSMVQ